MPLLPDAASLVAAASCGGESAALRRSALEAANAAFLGAARRVGPEGALFDDDDVRALLDAGLPDALLAAVVDREGGPGNESIKGAQQAVPPLREAAAGVFYNLCAHARRLWQATAEADAIYEQLCLCAHSFCFSALLAFAFAFVALSSEKTLICLLSFFGG